MDDEKTITDPEPPTVVEHNLEKSSNATTVQVGDQYVYEITATNKGDEDWEDVVAEDVLVDALTYVSADGDATVTSDGQVLRIDFGTIAAGESKTVYITVQVNDNAQVGETIENTVTIGDNKGTDPDGPEVEEKAAETHTVYYNANGGTGSYSVSVKTGDVYTVQTASSVGISRSGYTFTTWNTSADGSGTTYSSGSSITIANADITLYAQWSKNSSGGGGGGSTTYKVTYDGNGNTGGSAPTDSKSYSSGATVTVLGNTESLVKTSYTFAGWNTNADGTGTTYQAESTFTITSATTLYAVWTRSGSGGNGTTIDDSDVPLASLTTDHIWYIQGYPQNKVGPDNNLTRAEAAAIFYRLVADDSKDQKSFTNSFSDVSESNWYYKEVSYLANYKIILGYEDGTFRGDAFISRAEFAAIASRFDTLTLTEDNAFADVSSSHWAVRYINSAAAKGWITGYSDGTFRPDQNITRAETVTLVNRELNRALTAANEPDGLHVYADLDSSHWAYYDIMEASHTHEYDLDSNQEEVWTSYSYAKD
ncbi:MAG: S-layer homology domain-containing protein, partial [Oscillospiraceae bacterium]|nr:S-layer homology domain-containing protein [Oscillospiraceae bacterium]